MTISDEVKGLKRELKGLEHHDSANPQTGKPHREQKKAQRRDAFRDQAGHKYVILTEK